MRTRICRPGTSALPSLVVSPAGASTTSTTARSASGPAEAAWLGSCGRSVTGTARGAGARGGRGRRRGGGRVDGEAEPQLRRAVVVGLDGERGDAKLHLRRHRRRQKGRGRDRCGGRADAGGALARGRGGELRVADGASWRGGAGGGVFL